MADFWWLKSMFRSLLLTYLLYPNKLLIQYNVFEKTIDMMKYIE